MAENNKNEGHVLAWSFPSEPISPQLSKPLQERLDQLSRKLHQPELHQIEARPELGRGPND